MRRFIYLAGVLVFGPAAGAAQNPMLQVTVGGGRATDLRGVRGDAVQIAPSLLLFPDRYLSLSLSGRGTRFVTDDWSIAGAAGLAARAPLGRRLALSLALAGDATRTSFGATYLQGEAVPALEFRTGRVLLWGGARAAAGRRTLTREPALLPGDPMDRRLERSALGPAFGAALDLVDDNGTAARLSYREEHGSPAGGSVADRVAAATITTGRLTLAGSVGVRTETAGSHAYGGGRVGVAVGPALVVFAGIERYPANLLIDAPAGRAITAGVTIGSGIGSRRGTGPAPKHVPPPAPGETRLSIRARDAQRVEVAGDWNHWMPVELARAADGVWYGDLSIPPGLYRHAFRINGKVWRIPEGVAAVNDGFGGKSAWLSVPKRAPTQ